MKKLIVVDLDGTLLSPSLHISSYTEKVIKRLTYEGHVVVLASGRPYRAMKRFYEELGLSSPIICYNGAYVFHPKDPCFPKLERRFSSEALRRIAKANKESLLSFMAEGEKEIYLSKEDIYLDNYFPWKKEKYQIGEMDKIIEEDCYTAIFNCLDKDVPFLSDCLKKEGFILRHWNGNDYSEAALPDVNKGSALKHILSTLSIDPKDCYAFGDSDNDYEMLSIVSHPYGMKNNKSTLLKGTFPQTEKGNDQDGVAYELNKIFRLF